MTIAQKNTATPSQSTITIFELIETIRHVKPPMAKNNEFDVVVEFLYTWDNIPDEFKPKDEYEYEAMIYSCFDKIASEVGGISKGSDSWRRVARMFMVKHPYEDYACSEYVNSSSKT